MSDTGPDDWTRTSVIEQPHHTDAPASDFAPAPWYRNRVLLGLWAVAVVLLLSLLVYGIVDISRGAGRNGTPTPSSSTTSTHSSTTPSTTTAPTTPQTSPPSPTSEEAPPPPPRGDNTSSPAPTSPTHHRHHLHIPWLPHGF